MVNVCGYSFHLLVSSQLWCWVAGHWWSRTTPLGSPKCARAVIVQTPATHVAPGCQQCWCFLALLKIVCVWIGSLDHSFWSFVCFLMLKPRACNVGVNFGERTNRVTENILFLGGYVKSSQGIILLPEIINTGNKHVVVLLSWTILVATLGGMQSLIVKCFFSASLLRTMWFSCMETALRKVRRTGYVTVTHKLQKYALYKVFVYQEAP